MHKLLAFLLVASLLGTAEASWYWPFGTDDGEGEVRFSELVEPLSLLIDEASDLAGDGKVTEAVEKYRAALAEINRLEQEYPDRLESPEFATLKTKRAYISAHIDAMLMNQARQNAKQVAVSDTTELEKRLAEERSGAGKGEKGKGNREKVMEAIAQGDFGVAGPIIDEMLAANPSDAMGLNLKAAMETAEGKLREAERTLDRAIQSNPRDHFAYYNMAQLFLQNGNKSGARRYYETGRLYGGPEDAELEAAFK